MSPNGTGSSLRCHRCRAMRTLGAQFQDQESQSFFLRCLRKDMESSGLECRKEVAQCRGTSPSPPASSNSRDPCKARASLRNSVGIRRFSAGEDRGASETYAWSPQLIQHCSLQTCANLMEKIPFLPFLSRETIHNYWGWGWETKLFLSTCC